MTSVEHRTNDFCWKDQKAGDINYYYFYSQFPKRSGSIKENVP